MRTATSVMRNHGASRSIQGAGSRNNWYRGDRYKHGKCKSLTPAQIKALGYEVTES
jgi:hypothetical protein